MLKKTPLFLACLILSIADGAYAKKSHTSKLIIETDLGKIEIKLNHKAPKTTQAFIDLVKSGTFNLKGNAFYRIVTPENDTYIGSDQIRDKGIGVIQGGIEFVDPELKKTIKDPQSLSGFENSHNSGLKHKPGAFALGRSFTDDSVSLTEFFIDVEGHLDELNAGTTRYKKYAPKDTLGLPVIGYVSQGMPIVKKIYALRKNQKKASQMLYCADKADKDCKNIDQRVSILKMYIKE